MLEFLQTGKALSVLAAIGFIGFVSKMITRSLYKRLLKESENMAMTRNKNLKVLKQKLENTYRLNQNIINTQAYLDKLMYGFRFMNLSLDTWNNLSLQMMILGLLAGGTGSFLAYWYRLDAYYIVLYASVAALGGLFLAFLDSSFNIGLKQQKLETILLEYVDNSVFVRAARENPAREAAAARTVQTAPDRERLARENEIKDGLVHEEEARHPLVRPFRGRSSKAEELLQTVRNMKDEEQDTEGYAGLERGSLERVSLDRSGSERSGAARGKLGRIGGRAGNGPDRNSAERPEAGGAETTRLNEAFDGESRARRDIDYLKQSLDQIAASRDKSKEVQDWTKNLSSEEAKLISDIMREYFAGT